MTVDPKPAPCLRQNRSWTSIALVAFALNASSAMAQTAAPDPATPSAPAQQGVQTGPQGNGATTPGIPQADPSVGSPQTQNGSIIPDAAPAAPASTLAAPDQASTTTAEPTQGRVTGIATPSPDDAKATPPGGSQQGATVTELLEPERQPNLPHDLSPWGMFMAADWVVKAVMLGLAFASLVTWTVWLAKTVELAGARARAGKTLKVIRSSRSLAEAVNAIGSRGGPAALMLRAAAEEVQLSEAALDHAENGGVKERVASALSRIEAYAGRRMSRGTGVLATIGSTAPFVGLFGTVWGIMNSFIGISQANTTNLAVVAPGIAEALLATAIGLVAAIPAVVVYNVFARAITGYRQLLADAAAGIERLVSRDLDFRKVPPGSRKGPVSLVAGG